MIYILTGPNDFMRGAKKRSIIASFVKEYGNFSLEVIDGQEADIDRIRESLESLPFLAAKKLVVLDEPSSNKEFQEKYELLLKNLPDTTEVIINEPKFDKRSSYYKSLKKLDEYEEFRELEPSAVVRWAQEYVKKWEATIEPAAAQELVRRAGTDQLRLANELDKLSMYDKNITIAAVKELTLQTPSSTIFELIDAGFSGNKERALQLYEEQRALQVEPIQIVAMFVWQLHILALVKTANTTDANEIASNAKVNPYVIQKTHRIARQVAFPELKEAVSRLRSIDEKMKSTKIDADDALKAFIISL